VSDVVRCFNEGVRSGDWAAYGACFTPDATVTFDGAPVPPMAGREAIVAGYTSAPPDDTITVLSTTTAGDTAMVVYAWDTAPTVPAGTMRMTLSGELITSLTVGLTARTG
jgi:ketosteroid isomerase-like protein